jgi:hypothetical protein
MCAQFDECHIIDVFRPEKKKLMQQKVESGNRPDELNPLHKRVHEGKRRRIDLKALVTEVRLSPWATQEELAEVNTWVNCKNSSCLVTHSELTSKMTPTLEELRRLGR